MLIGLDIGGTKIEICVLDEQGSLLSKERIATPKDYLNFVSEVCRLILKLEKAIGTKCKVGIGLPGVISPTTGLIKNANCTFLNGEDLKGDLDKILTRSVKIANDANCFALSEAVDGAGKNQKLLMVQGKMAMLFLVRFLERVVEVVSSLINRFGMALMR